MPRAAAVGCWRARGSQLHAEALDSALVLGLFRAGIVFESWRAHWAGDAPRALRPAPGSHTAGRSRSGWDAGVLLCVIAYICISLSYSRMAFALGIVSAPRVGRALARDRKPQ